MFSSSKGKTIILSVLSTFVIVGLVWLYINPTQQPPSTYKIAYQPFSSNLPFFVAMEKGFFADNGIDIEPVQIISANDAANAIARGEIIGNVAMPTDVILNLEIANPGLVKIVFIKATSKKHWSEYLLVKSDSKISGISDLASRKIGVYPGSAQRALAKLLFKGTGDNHLINRPPEIVSLQPNVMLQALDSGQIDALLAFDQLAVAALDAGIAKTLVENPLGKYVLDPLYAGAYVLSSKFIKGEPEDYKSILRALSQAVDFIENDPTQARSFLPKWVSIDETLVGKVPFWDQIELEKIDVEALNAWSGVLVEEGIVQEQISIENLLGPR